MSRVLRNERLRQLSSHGRLLESNKTPYYDVCIILKGIS